MIAEVIQAAGFRVGVVWGPRGASGLHVAVSAAGASRPDPWRLQDGPLRPQVSRRHERGRDSRLFPQHSWRYSRRRWPGQPRTCVSRRRRETCRPSVVVGAGYAGATIAERAASQLAKRVLVVDRRPHVAGNAYDEPDKTGILVHKHGPHLFHTNSATVVDYLSRFTEWQAYEHRVLAVVSDKLVPIPINRTTINTLFAMNLDEGGVADFLARRAEPIEHVRTSEDAVVARVGRELYELFFRGYTRKQWGRDASELSASVTRRIPVRTNTDDRYFTDSFQALPRDGYTAMFDRILDHPLIEVALGVDFAHVRNEVSYRHLVWTGGIDEFYNHRFGALPYRSLSFEHASVETPDGGFFQPVTQVNYPSISVPFTRITEYRHLTRVGGGIHDCVRVSTGRRSAVLSRTSARKSRSVSALRGSRRARRGCDVRRAARSLSVSKYGPGRRSGASYFRADARCNNE